MAIQSTSVVQELAQVFHDRDQAVLLLQRAEFPMCMIPEFTTPLSFWEAVAEKARYGATVHGMQPILHEAAKMYPSNPMFGRRDGPRALDSWDHMTTRYLLSPPGVDPLLRSPRGSNDPGCTDLSDQPRLCFSMSFGVIGVPFPKALTAMACGLASTVTITSLALGLLSQVPSAVQPAFAPVRARVVERAEPRPMPAEEEMQILVVEDDPAPAVLVTKASHAKRGKKKATRRLGSKTPRGEPSKELRSAPWEYSIYNCLVGPDEPDERNVSRSNEEKKSNPNPKGACYWDDKRVFLMHHPQPNAPPSSPR